MNWLAVCVVLFIILMTLAGAKRGFVKTVMSFASVLITLLLVSFVREPVAEALKEHTQLYSDIESGIGEFIDGQISTAAGSQSLAEDTVIESLPIPQILREALQKDNSQSVYQQLGVSNAAEYITAWLAGLAFQAICYVLTFVGVWLLLRILTLVLDLISRLPGIHQLNSLAGGVCGLLLALITVWIGGILVTAFATAQWGREALLLIEESPLLSFLYNNNYLISGLIKTIM